MHPSVIPEVIASLQIDRYGRVREVLEIDGQNLLGHVIVVQLVVAESHVDIEGEILSIVQQDPLVDVNCLLIVRSDNTTYITLLNVSYQNLR